MKKYNIEQVYQKYLILKQKKAKKTRWNGEAVSYDINLNKIRIEARRIYHSGYPLTKDEERMVRGMMC